LMLSLADLGERERSMGDQLPCPEPFSEGDPSLDLHARRFELTAPAQQRSVHDVCHRRPRVLVELGVVHQLDRLARQCLGRELILLVKRDRGADSERAHGRCVNPGHVRGPCRRSENRLRLAGRSGPPKPGREHHLRSQGPERVGGGRGSERTTRVRDRQADVTAQQPQIPRQRGQRSGRLLTVARDRWGALGELEPRLGLIEPARVRANNPAGEADQPIPRRDRGGERVEPPHHRRKLSLVDEERVVAPDQLDRGVQVAAGPRVMGGVDDQTGVAVPRARAPVQSRESVRFGRCQLVF
jgi:hypothetical protein